MLRRPIETTGLLGNWEFAESHMTISGLLRIWDRALYYMNMIGLRSEGALAIKLGQVLGLSRE